MEDSTEGPINIENKMKEINNTELVKQLTRRKVLDQVTDMIESQDYPLDHEITSPLYRILVSKIQRKISEIEDNPLLCEIAAKKVAVWVEKMIKEACTIQQMNDENLLLQENDSPRKIKSAHSKTSLFGRSTGGGLHNEIIVEKVHEIPKQLIHTGKIFTANLGGSKVFVEEVLDGTSNKALVSKQRSSISNPLVREWSTWMVDIANKTKEWVKWLEDKSAHPDQSDLNLRQMQSSSRRDIHNSERNQWQPRETRDVRTCERKDLFEGTLDAMNWPKNYEKKHIRSSKRKTHYSTTNIHSSLNNCVINDYDSTQQANTRPLFLNIPSSESLWDRRSKQIRYKCFREKERPKTVNTSPYRDGNFEFLLLPSPPDQTDINNTHIRRKT